MWTGGKKKLDAMATAEAEKLNETIRTGILDALCKLQDAARTADLDSIAALRGISAQEWNGKPGEIVVIVDVRPQVLRSGEIPVQPGGKG
jgi:hypothetical protein